MVFQCAGAHTISKARLFEKIGRHAHILHTTGDHHVCIAELDGLGGQHHGFQRRPANLIDTQTLCFPGHTGEDRGLPGRILSVTAWQHNTHDHFIDILFLDAGFFNGGFNGNGAQLCRSDLAQGPVEISQRRSHRTDNNCFSHLSSPLYYIFRRYFPPTSKRAWVIWPSVQNLTDSISSVKIFSPEMAMFCNFFKASGASFSFRFLNSPRRFS